ncbi:hypothetical protein Pyn_06993 [Prunus yedoensis var. nudiflora]|uniref:Uncharacterized protein n=1 Tax=Prunus yedoensis var. nudiflora TaxID=2094558 RepID=A0A314ZL73_PRUYE|nr:hypothetical protein Pyn_06993 [Prunus yedoensis var. nudiflora]
MHEMILLVVIIKQGHPIFISSPHAISITTKLEKTFFGRKGMETGFSTPPPRIAEEESFLKNGNPKMPIEFLIRGDMVKPEIIVHGFTMNFESLVLEPVDNMHPYLVE